ncbi:hypothetical protein STAFG_2572 [Streptomyces afghaniensis 772]|uniref:Uncharacterized protein n=1 Tax=Streptomyces afghaniensis 772 TaxID=1283301 RepID=S4NPU3_9ACTN|nr:hypothetical protein STAFG_2572 [Streptomyces afghaniensis 772]
MNIRFFLRVVVITTSQWPPCTTSAHASERSRWSVKAAA